MTAPAGKPPRLLSQVTIRRFYPSDGCLGGGENLSQLRQTGEPITGLVCA